MKMAEADDLMHELFGDVIFSYTDGQAIEDGVLIPFIAGETDTRHRITRNAWNDLGETQPNLCES